MKGTVNISGNIGNVFGSKGVNLVDVVSQFESQKDMKEFDVVITTWGGSYEVGREIYTYIMSLKPKGVKINTIAKKTCASIGVRIFSCGDTRRFEKCKDFMIHNPWAEPSGDANYLEAYAKALRKLEQEEASLYSSVTGTDTETLKALMNVESTLSEEQAYRLGFITETGVDYDVKTQAVAFSNQLTNSKMTEFSEKEKSKIKELLAPVFNFFNTSEVKNLVKQDSKGRDINFPDVAVNETPKTGDKALIDDKPASEDVVMPSGETYIFKDGKLDSIKPKEESTDDKDQEILNLKKQLADAGKKHADEIKALNLKKEQDETALKDGFKTTHETFMEELKTNYSYVGKKKNNNPQSGDGDDCRFGKRIKK